MDEETIELIRRLFVELLVRLEGAHEIAAGGQAHSLDVPKYQRAAKHLAATGAAVTLLAEMISALAINSNRPHTKYRS